MEFLLDTANIDDIKKYQEIIPLSGVTTNPSIIKKEGKADFFDRLAQIKQLIGDKRSLHVQVVATTTEGIVADAHAVLAKLGKDVYIKIPVNQAGLAAIKILKKENVRITATSIYTELQGFLAIAAGADYLAPYYNRMENNNVDANKVISDLNQVINHEQRNTKILAASFHTVSQITSAIANGAQAVTVAPSFIAEGLESHLITDAISDFTSDWESIFGKTTISTL